ncbi:unnamed protein product [Dovyalis caffra]|uniref:Alpha/beta hydrolase fold-3 domain-containing protein n=1 Tax=Dovyalis caffra TaxID=77055 RepID=A0AAV1R8Y8_9ROSI|nr:unnamed protein product [Dovyalis caffra]
MEVVNSEIAHDFSPFFKVYKDGCIERCVPIIKVPPSHELPISVQAKDVLITTRPPISARIFMPQISNLNSKLPVLIHVNGGGFALRSPFDPIYQNYVSSIVKEANVIAVSIEYRGAGMADDMVSDRGGPEWDGEWADGPTWVREIRWGDCGLDFENTRAPSEAGLGREGLTDGYTMEEPCPFGESEVWASSLHWEEIFNEIDMAYKVLIVVEVWMLCKDEVKDSTSIRRFLDGCSWEYGERGVAYNLAVRIRTVLHKMKLDGMILIHPFFMGSKLDGMWFYLCPRNGGLKDPRLKPAAEDMTRSGCDRVLVFVVGRDKPRHVDESYCEELKRSGWKGNVELMEHDGVGHVFHLFKPRCERAMDMMKRLVSFINQERPIICWTSKM